MNPSDALKQQLDQLNLDYLVVCAERDALLSEKKTWLELPDVKARFLSDLTAQRDRLTVQIELLSSSGK
jgi:hypothetical protein